VIDCFLSFQPPPFGAASFQGHRGGSRNQDDSAGIRGRGTDPRDVPHLTKPVGAILWAWGLPAQGGGGGRRTPGLVVDGIVRYPVAERWVDHVERGLDESITVLLEEVWEWTAGAGPGDDVSILAVEIDGKAR